MVISPCLPDCTVKDRPKRTKKRKNMTYDDLVLISFNEAINPIKGDIRKSIHFTSLSYFFSFIQVAIFIKKAKLLLFFLPLFHPTIQEFHPFSTALRIAYLVKALLPLGLYQAIHLFQLYKSLDVQ